METNTKHAGGRPPKFKTPEELWEKGLEYFKECDDPKNWVQAYRKENAGLKQNGGGNEAKKDEGVIFIPKPYTLYGLAIHCGIDDWRHWRQYHDDDEFSPVIRALETRVSEKQVVGALCGVYNQNLTARLNGIAENTNTNVNGNIPVQIVDDGLD